MDQYNHITNTITSLVFPSHHVISTKNSKHLRMNHRPDSGGQADLRTMLSVIVILPNPCRALRKDSDCRTSYM